MFSGTYRHQLDDKLRFRIPTALRGDLGDNPKMIVGFDGYILIYTKENYKRFVDDAFEDIGVMSEDEEDLMRLIYSRTQPVEMDDQGRVKIDRDLAPLVNLTKNERIVTLGVGNRIEIWPEKLYDSTNLDSAANAARQKLREKMSRKNNQSDN